MASVYHYTTGSALVSMVVRGGLGSAWAAPLQLLNDRDELRLGLHRLLAYANDSGYPVWSDAIERLLDGAGNMESDVYSMSFSKEKDSLPQWLNYADAGFGICIEVDDRSLLRSKTGGQLCTVAYDDDTQNDRCREFFDRMSSKEPEQTDLTDLFYIACQMKNLTFQHEKEVRVLFKPEPSQIRFRSTHRRITPYVDFLLNHEPIPLKSVTLGPSWQLAKLKNRISGPDDLRGMSAVIKEPCYLGLLRFMEAMELDVPIHISQSTYSPN